MDISTGKTRLREALADRGLTLTDVAYACGVSRPAVAQCSPLAADPRAPHGDNPGAAGGAERARDVAGEIRQATAPIGAAALNAAIPRRSRTEEPEAAAGPSSAATDALGSAAFPGAGAAAPRADTLSRALGFPARHAAAGACLR
jgi:hypothetical protein